VIPTEDGLAGLRDIDGRPVEVPAFPLASTLQAAWEPLLALNGTEEHPYETVIIDSADWLERLIWQSLCEAQGKAAITDFDFGKGYGLASAKLSQLLKSLDGCRNRRGMHVVIVAHAQVVRFQDPSGDSYDRYMPKLHKDAAAVLMEWCDEVLFCNYETFTRREDGPKSRAIGTGVGQRLIHTAERPAWKAKNRLGLPEKIPMESDYFNDFVTGEK